MLLKPQGELLPQFEDSSVLLKVVSKLGHIDVYMERLELIYTNERTAENAKSDLLTSLVALLQTFRPFRLLQCTTTRLKHLVQVF